MVMTFELSNYRSHSRVRLALQSGVQLLVGPNGSGKTNILRGLVELARMARTTVRGVVDREAPRDLVNWHAPEDAPVAFELSGPGFAWSLSLALSGPRLTGFVEHLSDGRSPRVQIPQTAIGGHDLGELLRLRVSPLGSSPAGHLAQQALSNIRVYPELTSAGFDLKQLRRSGSEANADTYLQPDGVNLFTVLRNWRDHRVHRDTLRRVQAAFRSAYPDSFAGFSFLPTPGSVYGEFELPGSDRSVSAQTSSNGMLSWLLCAVAVAGAEQNAIVAIDEPETALHPDAQRRLLRFMQEEAERRDLHVVLSTHSGVLLDAMNKERDNIWALTGDPNVIQPQPMAEVVDSDWYAQFSPGALYQRNEFAGQAKSKQG